RNRSELAVRAMEANQLREVHVTETVTVGQAERPTIQITTDSIDARPGHRRFAGLGQSDAPAVLGVTVMKLNRARAQPHGEVFHPRLVVEEKIFDHVALVSKAQHKLIKPVLSVELHYV